MAQQQGGMFHHLTNPLSHRLARLAFYLACLAALMVAMNRLGVGDERFAGAAHSWREARWRLGGTWEDFRDWLRLGR